MSQEAGGIKCSLLNWCLHDALSPISQSNKFHLMLILRPPVHFDFMGNKQLRIRGILKLVKSTLLKSGMNTDFFFFFSWPHPQHVEVPGPGLKPTLAQRQCWILNPLSHSGNSKKFMNIDIEIYVCITESPCHIPETNTRLQINSTSIKK